MMELVENAGPLVWPIVAASAIGLALFLERVILFLRFGRKDEALISRVVYLYRTGHRDGAIEVCEARKNPVGQVLAATLTALDLPHDLREQVVRAAGNNELRHMERGVRGISVIARLAPLMGLLGTVVGLVSAFRAVASTTGPPNPSLLAGGIWQALLTTVAGLVVAIPAIISHEWLLGRIDEMAGRMEVAVARLLAVTGEEGEGAALDPAQPNPVDRGRRG